MHGETVKLRSVCVGGHIMGINCMCWSVEKKKAWKCEMWCTWYTRVMFLLLQTRYRTLWAATLWLLMMRHPSTTRSQMSSSRHHRNNRRSRTGFSRLSDPSDWKYYHPLRTQTLLENLLWYMKHLVLSRVTCDQLDVVAMVTVAAVCMLGWFLKSLCLVKKIATYRQILNLMLDSWPLKMGPLGCFETSVVRNYRYSLCNNPEERSSQI